MIFQVVSVVCSPTYIAMKRSIITYTIEDLLYVCLTRKKVMYSMLQNNTNADFQKYLFKVISENNLCFQNIHFTIADTEGNGILKTFHPRPGLSSSKGNLLPIMTISQCLRNERKSLHIFQTSLRHSLPMMVHLIIEHEVKCLRSSVVFLERFKEQLLQQQ